MMSQEEARANDVVTGTFLINSTPGVVLFDSGASNSFISASFASKLGLVPTSKINLNVKTASGKVVSCEDRYENVSIGIE